MSIEAINWAMRQQVGCSGAKFVLWVLANKADEAWSCFPSVSLIMAETEICERSVRSHIKALADEEFIEIRHDPGKASRYVINPKQFAESCKSCTPAKSAPLQKLPLTPANSANPPTPPYKDNPQLTQKSMSDRASDGLLERLWQGASPLMRKRSSRKKVAAEAHRLAKAGRDLSTVAAALERYVAEDEDVKAGLGQPALDRWLRDERFEAWLAEPIDWPGWIALWRQSRGWNEQHLGPPPDSPNHRIPAEHLHLLEGVSHDEIANQSAA